MQRIQALVFRYASRLRNTIYHFKTANFTLLKSLEWQRRQSHRLPWWELIQASWKHGASFADYYFYRFFEKETHLRRTYLTTSLRHELTRQLNDPQDAQILRDKALFASHFGDLIGRKVWTWESLQSEDLMAKPPRLVFKFRWGQQGDRIFFPKPFASWQEVRAAAHSQLERPEDYLYEAYIEQHPALAALYPHSVHTVRVVTCLENETVKIWSLVFKIGVSEGSDNFSMGGMAAELSDTGQIQSYPVYKNPFLPSLQYHPHTHEALLGFQLPYFEKVKSLAIESAKRLPEVRTVGWDIAILPTGSCLVEGNENWGAHITQVPLGKGIRHFANQVCDMFQVYD